MLGHFSGRKTRRTLTVLLAAAVLWCAALPAAAGSPSSRIKDIAFVGGTTTEPLVGYGLVIGLNGTGDSPNKGGTSSSLATLLEKLDVTVSAADLKAKNVAEVVVTAQLDPNSNVGARLDVKVNSMNDATSLEGGHLVMTPLKAMDGTVCVVAQGSISIGGFNVNGGAGNSVRKNHAQAGIVANGGTVKAPLGGSYVHDGKVSWLLHNPDFATASAVADVINARFGGGTARAKDAQCVEVTVPAASTTDPVGFIADMGVLEAVSDAVAKVVLNERTGTIIVGKDVKLREAAVAHGTLKVVVSTYFDVSQPSSFSRTGSTVVTPEVNTDVTDHDARVLHVPDTSTVADVVGVLNEIGATPRDIIAILEALKRAGALQAELELM